MPKETIEVKTANGTVKVTRTDKTATITQQRNVFGYKEKIVTEITKVDDDCMHYVFGTENEIKEIFKNY